jgi:hypothetical protein
VFFHILMFVIWLGMDVGVYYCGKYTTRRDLTYQERRRFLELLMLLDMGPRTALVMMVPLGLQLSQNLGLIALPPLLMTVIWVAGLSWLALVWLQYLQPGSRWRPMLARIDYSIRYLVIGAFILGGLGAIFFDAGISGAWLRLKLVLFGAVISMGLVLRATLPPWLAALEELKQKPGSEAAQARVETIYAHSGRWAHGLWAFVVLMGFLGTVKPF